MGNGYRVAEFERQNLIPYQKVFQQLSRDGVRYLVAGGFAVNFHQVQRATVDLDLIIQIETQNIGKLVHALKELGFVPRLPVNAADLAIDSVRKSWIQDKGMMVFSFINPINVFEVIDIFCDEPKPFDQLWSNRLDVIAFGITIPVIGKNDLIELKTHAGRDKDKFDVEQLKKT